MSLRTICLLAIAVAAVVAFVALITGIYSVTPEIQNIQLPTL
jgi:K+ transporter